MLLAAREAKELAAGLDRDGLAGNRAVFLAVQKLIENVGEAASRLSDEARNKLPALPWKDIVGMRHRLVHDYMRVDVDRVWTVVDSDLGMLITAIESQGINEEPRGK